jgi:hypothetical protein
MNTGEIPFNILLLLLRNAYYFVQLLRKLIDGFTLSAFSKFCWFLSYSKNQGKEAIKLVVLTLYAV